MKKHQEMKCQSNPEIKELGKNQVSEMSRTEKKF